MEETKSFVNDSERKAYEEPPYEEIGFSLTPNDTAEMLKKQKSTYLCSCLLFTAVAAVSLLLSLLFDGFFSYFTAYLAGVCTLGALFLLFFFMNLRKQEPRVLREMPFSTYRICLYDDAIEIYTLNAEGTNHYIDRQEIDTLALVTESQTLYFATLLGRIYTVPKAAVPQESRLFRLFQSKMPKNQKKP